MQGGVLLAIALLLGFVLPGVLLVALVLGRAREGVGARPLVTVVLVSVGVAALLSAALRPLAEASPVGAAWTPIVFTPVVEEVGKGIGLLFAVDALRRRVDALALGAIAGLSFAMVENLLYVLSEFLLAGPAAGVATGAVRAGPLALHAAASALVGEAIWSARAGRRGTGLVLFVLAFVTHGASNAATRTGFLLPLLVDLAVAALVLARGWRARREAALSPRSPLAPP